MRLPYVLGLACTFGLAGSIFAQTAPAPASTPTRAQGQTSADQTAPYPSSLYRMNGVGQSLNLTQDQMNGLNKLTTQTQATYRDQYGKLNGLNGADRAARLRELNNQYNSAWNKGASSILNKNQLSRYQQLNYQYGGFSALNDPDVQQRMNLTAAQVNALPAQEAWSNKQLEAINQVRATNPTKAAQMYSDYLTQRQARMNKFLTPDQQKEWRQVTGEPYTFQSTSTPSR